MKSSTKILIPTVALSVLTVAGLIGVSGTFAQEETDRVSWTQKIAEHFNLNQDDVDNFFESERENRQAEMQQKQEDRLSNLVSEGKLTEEQKQKIIEKCEEMKADREANGENFGKRNKGDFKEMTEEERQVERDKREQERETRQSEMKGWLKEIGIDVDNDDFYKELMPLLGNGGLGNGGHRGHGGFGLK